MRKFKRLFPVLLVSILLAGVVLARPAGMIRTNHRLVAVSKPQIGRRYSDPQPDFGTVVRDTADEPGAEPGHDGIPSILQQEVPQGVPLWCSFSTWSWFGLLLAPR